MALSLEDMAPLLQVYDMPTSLRFYRDVLGLTVAQSSGQGDDVDWVLLKGNGIELMLNTAYERESRPAIKVVTRETGHRDVTLYFGHQNMEEAYEHLLSKGIALQKPSITGYGWKAISFEDPDGYQICCHWPV